MKKKAELLRGVGGISDAPPATDIEPAGPAKPVDEDEDIFADAGHEYVIERRQPVSATNLTGETAASKTAYFAGPSVLESVPEVGPARPPAVLGGGGYPDAEAVYVDKEALAELQKEREAKANACLARTKV